MLEHGLAVCWIYTGRLYNGTSLLLRRMVAGQVTAMLVKEWGRRTCVL